MTLHIAANDPHIAANDPHMAANDATYGCSATRPFQCNTGTALTVV